MPQIKIELEKQALKITQLIDIKNNCLRRNQETKDSITKRQNIKILSDTTNH